MKVNLEKLTNLERKLHIEIPVEHVMKAFDRVYKSIQQGVSIKGFRKGKTPLDMVKKMYQEKVHQDVIETLVREFYPKALSEHNIHPISYPNIEFEPLKENTPFQFSANFEIKPDVNLQKYKGLSVQKENLAVGEEQIQSFIMNLRNTASTLVPVLEDRPAQNGDVAVIDFDGFVDGQPLENAQGKEHELALGANQFIPGFEEGVVGMKVGSQKTLNLKFPEEYHATQIAGKAVEFKVHLQGLKKREMPELDDTFCEKYGHKTVIELTESVQKNLTQQEEKRIKEDLKSRIMKKLVEVNPVDVPKALLNEQKKILQDDVVNRMKGQGVPESDCEEYLKKWDEDFTQSATFIIQSSFLINAVAAKENIHCTEDDIDNRITDFATESGIDYKMVREFYKKPDQKSRLEFQVLEEKVADFLISQADVKSVPKDKLS